MNSLYRSLTLIALCVACLGQAGCIILAYAIDDAHTPLRDVSDTDECWGGFKRGGMYVLQVDVFMADYKHYSLGPGLAPGKGVRTERSGGMWGGPTTAEEYRKDPERWPDIMGLVDAGTRLRCVQVKRRNYLLHDMVLYAMFAEILDGPRKGEKVEITELTVCVDKDSWLLRPDTYLLKEVSE